MSELEAYRDAQYRNRAAASAFAPERVKTITHPDLHGHISDAIQDAIRRRLGRIVPTDFCCAMASDIIEHFEELKVDV